MNIADIANSLEAKIIVKGEEKGIKKVFAGDRISDLIHFADEETLVITHLNQISLVQLYQIFDVPAVCLITESEPIEELVRVAEAKNAYLFVSPFEMYETCGVIYRTFEQEKLKND